MKYKLLDTEFDANSLYVGHGVRLTLAIFTNAWSDPFEGMLSKEAIPKIRSDVEEAISSIRRVQKRFEHDAETQGILRNYLVAWVKSRGLNEFLRPDSLNSVVPSLDFYIFVGRRHNIDLTPATH